MKHLFYYFLITILLLFSPVQASHTFDEDAVTRGFNIYQSLSLQWMESRETIAKKGTAPFIEHLSAWMAVTAFDMPEVAKRIPAIAGAIKTTAPDIQMITSTILATNQKAYRRPSIFISLDISKANVFLYALGKRYQNADTFIAEVVQYYLPRTSDYNIFTKWCDSIDPALKMFFDTYIFNPSIPREKRSIHAMACQLMWYEPHQIFFHAINTRLEDILKEIMQLTGEIRVLPLTSHLNNGVVHPSSTSTNSAPLFITYPAPNIH